MSINLGNTAITSIKLGTTNVDAVYLGNDKVFPNPAPSIPNGLFIVTEMPTTVRIQWTDSTPGTGGAVTGYNVYRDGIFLAFTPSISYNDNSVIQWNIYNYTVSAIDVGGNESNQSLPISGFASPAKVTSGAIYAVGMSFNTGLPIVDSSSVTMSFWLRPTNNNNNGMIVLGTNGIDFINGLMLVEFDNKLIKILARSSSGQTTISINATTQIQPNLNTWSHIMFSVNSTNQHFYINNILQSPGFVSSQVLTRFGTQTVVNGNRDNLPTGGGITGDFAEYFYAPGKYIDLSIASNREKFISADGHAVNLGVTGSIPVGSPYVYISGDAAVWNAGTNLGSGPNFIKQGSSLSWSNSSLNGVELP